MMVLALLAVMTGSPAAPAIARSERVTLTVVPNGVAVDETVITLRKVRAVDGVEGAEPDLEHVLRGKDPLMLDLEPGTWRLDVENPELWHAAQSFTTGPDRNTEISVPVWPRSTLTGAITHEASAEPAEILVRFEPATAAHSGPSGETRCPLVQRKFRCSMPAGTYSLRIRPRGYIAHYRAELELDAEKTQDLGTLELREGQSITGRIQLPARSEGELRDVVITANPKGTTGQRLLAVESRPEKNGFFHLDGLAPGAYVVGAALRRALYAEPVEVVIRGGSEAELIRPLLLAPPRKIELAITPPVAFDGTRWHVKLFAEVNGTQLEEVSESNASGAGVWSSAPLRPGLYRLTIATLRGEEWHREAVLLGTNDYNAIVALSRTDFPGTLSLGERPLQASLTFSGSSGFTAQTESDAEGRFRVMLPASKEEHLKATIASEVPPVQRRLVVQIPAEGQSIDIALPDSILMGEVVDAAGVPVGDALVTVAGDVSQEGIQQVTTAGDGKFAMHGLSPGVYTLVAAGLLSESEPVTAELRSDETPEPIRLTVREAAMLRGRVVSPLGPVPGASVHARAINVPHTITHTRRTDAGGGFTVALPPGARTFEVLVAAQGFAFVIAGGAISDRPFTVGVDQRGGTLVIRAARDHDAYIVHNGATIPAVAVDRHWPVQSQSLADGSHERVLPMMEPGSYSACIVEPSQQDRFRATAGATGGRCLTGFLPPFGSLTLDLRP
jgi:hypothetical protein